MKLTCLSSRLSSLIALAAVSLPGLVHAADTTLTTLAKPDLAAGAAKAALCAACHVADGTRGLPTFPILQGQHPEYIVKQLSAFKEGQRQNPIMNGMAAVLSPEDMRHVAAFYASKKAPDGLASQPELAALGQQIYRGGIAQKSVPACAACHGPHGAGMPALYPRLAGQHSDYTKAQLTAFRQGDRHNSPEMAAISAKLSDKDIDALADYLAGLR